MRRVFRVVGVVLVGVGALGFFQNPVLGLFAVNLLHNIVHLASGALTLLAAHQGIGPMRTWANLLGLLYLIVAIAGFTAGNLFGMMHLNIPDNLLHLALAVLFAYYGLLAPPRL